MPAPKGHPPYPGCEKGAPFGFLAKDDNAYTEEEAIELGVQLIKWFFITRKNIWANQFWAEEAQLDLKTVRNLEERYPRFKKFTDRARQLQEGRLVSMPLNKDEGIDGYHARWMLARHHKGEWQDQNIVTASEQQKQEHDKTLSMVDHLQSQVQKQDLPRDS